MIRYYTVAVVTFVSAIMATEWYASPLGSGVGTYGDPYNLQTALTNSSLAAGDTLWLREGTYQGSFSVSLHGLEANPVVIRNFDNERATIDGYIRLNTTTNVWFWGLEITDSSKESRSVPFDTVSGTLNMGVKFINCMIHDCCIGLAGGPYEAYGNIMWYCGRTSTEHAIYWQNDGSIVKRIQNNLIGYPSGFGVHNYSGSGLLKGYEISGNAIWGAGETANSGKAAILVGGGTAVENLDIVDNHIWNRNRGIQLGYSVDDNVDAKVRGNVLYGGRPLYLAKRFSSLTVTNNVSMTVDDGCVFADMSTPFDGAGPYVWDINVYMSTRIGVKAFVILPTTYTFAEWKTLTSFDNGSSFDEVAPSGLLNRVVVVPNAHEAKRCHIIVWNWQGSATATVDVSSVLQRGNVFEVRSAMNFYGNPVLSGVYDGGLLTLPLTNLELADVKFWTGYTTPWNVTTNFGAFVLIGGTYQNIKPRRSALSTFGL